MQLSEKNLGIVGTLRNSIRKYVVFFESTEQGEALSSEKLLQIVSEKQEVHSLLQVIMYWLDDNQYRIDFIYWQDNNM
jgi:hypothetical protein